MHDLNHALAEFIDRAPGLNRDLIQYSCKRASSRAWRFIKGKPVSMRKKLYIMSLYLKSIMLFPDHPKNHILKTRQAFEWAGHIRTPGKHC